MDASINLWLANWTDSSHELTPPSRPESAAHLAPMELIEFFKGVLGYVGQTTRNYPPRRATVEDIRLGGREVGRDAEELASWAAPLAAVAPEMFMYACVPGDRGVAQRVAGNGLFPVNVDFYSLFRRGEVEFYDLRPEHIEVGSDRALIPFGCELPHVPRRDPVVGRAVMRTFAFQMGRLCGPRGMPGLAVKLISFEGTKLAGDALRSKGFNPVEGIRTRYMHRPVFEMDLLRAWRENRCWDVYNSFQGNVVAAYRLAFGCFEPTTSPCPVTSPAVVRNNPRLEDFPEELRAAEPWLFWLAELLSEVQGGARSLSQAHQNVQDRFPQHTPCYNSARCLPAAVRRLLTRIFGRTVNLYERGCAFGRREFCSGPLCRDQKPAILSYTLAGSFDLPARYTSTGVLYPSD